MNAIPLSSTKQVNTRYKKNETVEKVLLSGDKFMPEMHLRQPGFTKNKERIQKLKKQEIHDIFIKTD